MLPTRGNWYFDSHHVNFQATSTSLGILPIILSTDHFLWVTLVLTLLGMYDMYVRVLLCVYVCVLMCVCKLNVMYELLVAHTNAKA